MRDPFANYDSWLDRPYQDQCEQDEWILENETAECADCGYDYGKRCELDTVQIPNSAHDGFHCPECNTITEVKIVEPEPLDDDYDYEPPEPDWDNG